MSYDQKKQFSRWRPPPSWILKFKFSFTWLQSGSTFAVVYQISSKSDDFSLRFLNDFQNGIRLPFWILKICSFCYVALSACRSASWCTMRYACLLPSFCWYQIILLGDRDRRVWTTCLRLLRSSVAAGPGSNPRLLDRKSDALPLSHRALPPLWSDRGILCNLCPAFVSFFSRLNVQKAQLSQRDRAMLHVCL